MGSYYNNLQHQFTYSAIEKFFRGGGYNNSGYLQEFLMMNI